ncbi:YebC/PmpR family DNA-binding transcriptional regulator [Alienimonas sp. DA493]|uniref:YebC/PmpR family DNA-binding transcriptional regulator n=1 Tax=Alienimonas sp. DA493 TaxID=3373605 RepID=UPI003753FA1F
MAGHSHWANIQRSKGIVDKKRGKLFGKLSRLIIVAARSGGPDPDMNLRLRYAIDKAKAVSMPKDNIERAVKKGAGELDTGESFDEVIYEGYAPGGVAVLCDILTDNRNRTAGEIRKTFDRFGGSLGTTGCVAYLFDQKGVFTIPASATDEETLFEVALEAGAEDVKREGSDEDAVFEVLCPPTDFDAVAAALKEAGIEPDNAEVTRVPQNYVDLDNDTAGQVLRLMEELEDNDDVQSVSANFNLPDGYEVG